MLRQVFVVVSDNLAYQRSFAKGLETSLFSNIIQKVKKAMFSKLGAEAGTYNFFEFKLSFIGEKSLNLIILFVSGLGDEFKDIELKA